MIRVVVVGLGPIGAAAARAVRAERDLELVGLIDTDPDKVGKTLGDLFSHDLPPGRGEELRVTDQLDAATERGADVALLCTASRFDRIAPTLKQLISHRLSVVSSCEQMTWPWYQHSALADQIDAEAKSRNVALLATGVNPGFVMDALPVVLSTMFRRVTGMRCVRRVDASLRRQPLQAKVGATKSREQFMAMARDGKIGHMGLPESVAMLAAGLGRHAEPGSIREVIEPVVVNTAIKSGVGLIEPGFVSGLHQVAQWMGDGLRIELDLTMAVGLEDPKDVIELDGPVQARLKIPGGLPGDSATVATLINHIRVVNDAKPGLRTMLDVPPAGCRSRDVEQPQTAKG